MKKPYPFHYINSTPWLISILLSVLLSCSTNRTEQEALLHNLTNYRESGKQVLLFVPLDGCGTCIQHSSEFINKNLLSLEYLRAYVYSLYNKRYALFDSLVVNSDRLVKDTDSKILSTLKVEQKPKVIFIKDGKILEETFFDNANENDIFKKITAF